MQTLCRTLLAGAVSTLVLGTQVQAQDRLVIAGRDGAFAQALSLMVEQFGAANPSVEIERLELPYGGLLESVTIAMREESGAFDVIMLDDTWAVEFMSNGWLADLDALGGGLDDDFVPSAVSVARYPVGEGPLYAVPFVGNVEMFAYRSDLLDTYAGGAPGSWTDVLEAARAIDAGEEGVSGVVFRGTRGNPIVTGFLPILWAHGGRIVDDAGEAALNSPQSLQALNLFLDLAEYAPTGVETYNSSEVRDALMQGTAAISIELWPSWAPALDDPGVSTVPGLIEVVAAPGEVEGPAPMLGTWLLAVPADAENPSLARAFIDFVTSAENQRELALAVGTPPTRMSVYGDADVVERYRWYPAQLDALLNARPRPRITQWSRVETTLGDYLQLALIGEMTPEDALAEAHDRIARDLRR